VRVAKIVAAVVHILGERGQPLPIGPLHELVKQKGIVIGGQDEKRNLSSKLSVSSEVYNHKPFGWWLVSRRHELDKGESPEVGASEPSDQINGTTFGFADHRRT